MKKQTVRYEVAGKTYEGLAVWDDSVSGKRPAVLIAPTFMGVSALEEEKAEKLAKLGYAAFIADIFGVDVRPQGIQCLLRVRDDQDVRLRFEDRVSDRASGLVAILPQDRIRLEVSQPEELSR